MTFGNKKMRFDQTKQTTEDIKVKFSQICSMKSMGSVWENLKIQLALKGLIAIVCLLFYSRDFSSHTTSVQQAYSEFLGARERYKELLSRFLI
mgnify:CR=1 FL=1